MYLNYNTINKGGFRYDGNQKVQRNIGQGCNTYIHILTLRFLFLTLLALMLLALLLAMYIGLARKRGICAERIVTDGEHLTIGGDYYSYAYIEKIRLTSPRKKSSSIFPVQRYIYVSANGMTKKYWLGSEVSFRAYGSLCRSLELSMVLHPSKLRYK